MTDEVGRLVGGWLRSGAGQAGVLSELPPEAGPPTSPEQDSERRAPIESATPDRAQASPEPPHRAAGEPAVRPGARGESKCQPPALTLRPLFGLPRGRGAVCRN